MMANLLQEHSEVFNARFNRCRGLLYFIARRVLGRDNGAADAVHNCGLRASRNLRDFAYEGAFRSWLIRILIDEALVLRDKKEESHADENLACECTVHPH